jgi:hypothetical protein
MAERRGNPSHDFLLLLILFVAFRLGTVFFFRPGGYMRDYSDLTYYQSRASWQDFGFLPYRDYWSEYPPLFAWLSVGVDRVARAIPAWEDQRLWYAAIFGVLTVAAESLTLVALYRLARRIHGDAALRVAWLYAGLFLPVYLLGGWFDALPVATVMGGLALLVSGMPAAPLLAGALIGAGGALKLVPLALLAVVPLALARLRDRLIAWGSALAVVAGAYGIAYLNGPAMTLASVRSLVDRSGWSTFYAWAAGFHRVGALVGDVFDPAADMSLYESRLPQGLLLAVFAVIGLALWIATWRRERPPQSARSVVGFAALTYALLLLYYPAWNPQYALYLLPFLVLLWPSLRGVCYALALSAVCLAEHPVYVNLIGPNQQPSLLLVIIVARTALLIAIALDLGLMLLRPASRVRWAPVGLAGLSVLGLVAAAPMFAQAYTAGRWAANPARVLTLYLNALPDDAPIVTQQLGLSRQLRPSLERVDRLQVAGGRPGRLDPLPDLLAAGPFRYVEAPGDGDEILTFLDQSGRCPAQLPLDEWRVWLCNGAERPPIASFSEGIELEAAQIPDRLPADGHLPVTLFWSAERPLERDYTVFVHVVGPDGQMVGQWDQVPAAGKAPISGWMPGQLIADEYRIPVRAGAGEGPYRVYVGMYDPATGARLDIASPNPVSERRLLVQTIPSQ